MAKFELNVYSENDEILKTCTRDFCPTALFLQAVKLSEKQKENKATELQMIEEIIDIVRTLFTDLTNEDIQNKCDIGDVINVFKQIVKRANTIESSKN